MAVIWRAESLLVLATIIAVFERGSSICHLNSYVASCILDIVEEHIEATAIINHCHLPLDVTFLVSYQYGNSTRHNWKYTFVTANQNERVLIPGLLLPTAPHAPVFLYARVPEKEFDMHNSSFVAIEASFVAELRTDEWEEAEFLNHTIYIDTTDDCRFSKSGQDPIPWIVGGLFIITILSGLIGGGFYLYRKKKLELDQLALVSAMEVGLPGAQPYQLEAVTNQTESKSEAPSNTSVQPDSVVNEVESNGDSAIDLHSADDNVDEGSSSSHGFGFGRLKEEKASVVIGNPAYQEDSVPSRKVKRRKSSRRSASSHEGEISQGSRKEISQRSQTNKDRQDVSLENKELPNSETPVENGHHSLSEHPLEDSSSDDGMPVGEGARRKVRGVPTLNNATSVIAPEVQVSSGGDSQKGL
ncbi:hypothetical protein SK128_015880 [Halocaridina rubra]|uniref:Uncharacterized protein n=1 Tax=Halocaridina rubra TaxID=373956 RepID=A0AAN9AGB4_HALRR